MNRDTETAAREIKLGRRMFHTTLCALAALMVSVAVVAVSAFTTLFPAWVEPLSLVSALVSVAVAIPAWLVAVTMNMKYPGRI